MWVLRFRSVFFFDVVSYLVSRVILQYHSEVLGSEKLLRN